MSEEFNSIKRYWLLLTLIIILLLLGTAYRLIKKRSVHKTQVHKIEVIRQSNKRKR